MHFLVAAAPVFFSLFNSPSWWRFLGSGRVEVRHECCSWHIPVHDVQCTGCNRVRSFALLRHRAHKRPLEPCALVLFHSRLRRNGFARDITTYAMQNEAHFLVSRPIFRAFAAIRTPLFWRVSRSLQQVSQSFSALHIATRRTSAEANFAVHIVFSENDLSILLFDIS